MKKVIILRGCSGSGKSTYIKEHYPSVPVFSADDYFVIDGQYLYDSTKIKDAHDECFSKFKSEIVHDAPFVVVDNTNVKIWEFERYVEFAMKYGYDVQVVRLQVDSTVAASRNLHGVPAHVIEEMNSRMENFPGETIIVM